MRTILLTGLFAAAVFAAIGVAVFLKVRAAEVVDATPAEENIAAKGGSDRKNKRESSLAVPPLSAEPSVSIAMRRR